MKKQTRIILIPLMLYAFTNAAFSQTSKVATTIAKSDSADLKALVIKLLKWHEADNNSDFELIQKNPKDTIYSSIDWQAHKRRMVELEKTGFFTQDFFNNYQNIASHLDKQLKTNKIRYVVGELPPYGNGANEWCNCQDYPSNSFNRIKIVALKYAENVASFKWTWGNKFFYSVKAKKEKNIWKIADLERFKVENFSW